MNDINYEEMFGIKLFPFQKQLIDTMLKLNMDDKLIVNYPCRSGRYFTKMMYNICYKMISEIELTNAENKWLIDIRKGEREDEKKKY